MPDFRRILIIKPSSMGDVVHALPTLSALRRTFPSASITWLVKRQWAGLLERAEELDRVWPVAPWFGDWLSQVPRLREANFDLVVDLQGLFRSGAIAWLTGCPVRIGFANAREGSPFFYTQRVPVPVPDLHAVDRYLLVAAALGAEMGTSLKDANHANFRLRVGLADREEVANLLSRHSVSAGIPWIAMNVSARWPTKRWPPEFFAAAADRIQEEKLGTVVLIGGPDERAASRRVRGLMHTVPADLTGKTTSGLLPALLESASVLLTNDSGPMHVAAAVGTPVVAIFGPTSPTRTGPYGKGHRVLANQIPCSPCFSRTCRNSIQLECLTNITPEKAIEAVRDQLKRGNGAKGLNGVTDLLLPTSTRVSRYPAAPE